MGDGAGRVHQTPQTRSSDERRARASIRWAECRAFEAEPAGEAAATLARGASAHWNGAENGHGASQWLKKH